MTPPAATDSPAPGDTAPPSYAIGGTLTGLAASTKLVLLDNGGDALTLAANGAFGFAAPVAFNTAYSVTVSTQPLWQNCGVSNGSGTATADVNSVQVGCVEAQPLVSTLAGSTTAGSADGTGTAASFNTSQAIAVDGSGNIYVADSGNNEIRKITPDGVVTTLAGSTTPGLADGTGTAARFDWPDGIEVDASGNVYVANSATIRKIAPNGVVTTLAGNTTQGSADGSGAAAQFNEPAGLAIDASGNVYVADWGNNMIRKITPGGVVTTLAGSIAPGSANGIGAAASFNGPAAVKVDAAGNVYVADLANNMIRKITPDGVVTTLVGSTTPGSADGVGTAASFNAPNGLGIDASGCLYVADLNNNRIRKITPDGVVTTFAGSPSAGSADGIGTAAKFDGLADVTVDASGNLYAISGNTIRKLTPVR